MKETLPPPPDSGPTQPGPSGSAGSAGPSGQGAPAGPVWGPVVLPKADTALATVASQVAAYALCAATLVLVGIGTGGASYALGAAAVLGAGVLVGTLTPLGLKYRNAPGLLWALLSVPIMGLIIGVAGLPVPPEVFLGVPLFIVGTDWRFVRRLRGMPFWCGLVVMAAAAAAGPRGFWIVGVWLLLALGALWLLQSDSQMGLTHGLALDPTRRPGRPARVRDLVRVIAIAIGGGMVLGLLLGQQGCLAPPAPKPWGEGTAWRRATTDEIPPVLKLDEMRREQGYTVDQNGNRTDYPRREDARVRDYGDIVVVDDDRGSRVYSHDEFGRDRVRVTTPDGRARTFTYDDSGPTSDVYETNDDNQVIRRYRYEGDRVLAQDFRHLPNWKLPNLPMPGLPPLPSPNFRLPFGSSWMPGTPNLPNMPNLPNLPDLPNLPNLPKVDKPGTPPWKLGAGLAALAVAAGLAWYLWGRRPGPEDSVSWAEALVKRVDDLGAAHGHPRGSATTVTQHTASLGSDVLTEPELVQVGRVASDALFGRTQPGPETRAWAESVVDKVTEAHPPPTRRERKARDRAAEQELADGTTDREPPGSDR